MDPVNVRLMRALSRIEDSPPVILCVQNNLRARFGEGASLMDRFLFWRMKQVYPQADRVVASSDGIATQLQEMDLGREEKVSVIYNAGVDSQTYKAKERNPRKVTPKEKPLIVACGSLTPQKGYTYLLNAFSRVTEQIDSKLWILGEGKIRKKIEKQIERLNLENDVSLLGFRDNPFKFMATSDLFILSSVWEGFGNVIIEAMACGTPVIATDCPHGPGEIITHEKNGVLVPPANAQALSDAMLRLLNDNMLRKEITRSAKDRARDFHASKIGQEYLNLFREVVTE